MTIEKSNEILALAKQAGYIHDPESRIMFAHTRSVMESWLQTYKIYLWLKPVVIGSDEWEWAYQIWYIPRENREDKRRSLSAKEIESFVDRYPYDYYGAWYEQEEAWVEGFKKAITLI